LDPDYQEEKRPFLDMLLGSRKLVGPVDLTGIIIGEQGPVSDLWSANLYMADVEGCNLSYSLISGSMSEARFTNVMFFHAEFKQALMHRTVFEVCNFENAKFLASANDAQFIKCHMVGCAFKGRGIQEWGGRRTIFQDCDLRRSAFKGCEFRSSKFINCLFDQSVFDGCDLRGAKFEGSTPRIINCIGFEGEI
jgi:uncharacterized protein YjbI with pentapeptide repeats